MSSASSIQRSCGEGAFFDEIEDKSSSGERSSDSGRIQGNDEVEDVDGTDRTGEYSDESDFSSRNAEIEDDFPGSSGWGTVDSSCTSDGDRSASFAVFF